MKKRDYAKTATHTLFFKAVKKGNPVYRYWFFAIIAFRIIRWLFTKAQPTKIDEYELSPGEYKVVIEEPQQKSGS